LRCILELIGDLQPPLRRAQCHLEGNLVQDLIRPQRVYTRLYSLDELIEHPQLQASGLFQTMQHPTEGTIRYVRPTTKFSKSPASVRSAPPNLGEHSCAVLREAGYAHEQIEALLQQGAVVQHPRGA
jgi:crotonobetainyl-CoA:carnitine CoA-transferase CaiB-like acyl-CoA transferase